MSVIEFPDRLIDRLKSIARTENRSPDAVLEDMLQQYQPRQASTGYSTWPLQMALMAEADSDQIEWTPMADDLSTRSREILNQEFAADLLRRQGDE